MASRAKLRVDDGWAAAGSDPGPAAAPVGVRLAVLGALVLLAGYTAYTGWRTSHVDPASGQDQPAGARSALLAARSEALATGLATAAQAGAEVLRRNPAAPLDAAETTLKLDAAAKAAAVIDPTGLIGAGGHLDRPDWAGAARSAARSGRAVWIGAAPNGAAYLYAAAEVVTPRGLVRVIAAADLSQLAEAGPGESAALADASGRILSGDGYGMLKDLTLRQALGIFPSDAIEAAGKGGEHAGLFADGVPARLNVTVTADRALIAVSARPASAVAQVQRREVRDGLAPLLVPLLIALLLALLLLRQIRLAEAAHRARNDSERRFRLAVEAARCGIWEWRLEQDTVLLSDVTGVMFGWGGGGVVSGEDLIARIAPEHRERVRQALREARTFGGFDVSFRVPGLGREGEGAWVDARGQAFGAGGAQGYDSVLGVALDVTVERTIERRVQLAERRLHDAIESVSQGFVLWDRSGRLLLCNKPYRDFFSLEPRLLKPGADRRSIMKLAELAVKSWAPSPDQSRALRRVEMMDGRWLEISERRTADGGLVMTASDITTIKRQDETRRVNETALQQAVDTLEENRERLETLAEENAREKLSAESANRAKSEFLANMSHELRTPLNAINGFSEMMVSEMFGPLGDKRYRDYAADILASGQHLLALINDILDMSKIEAGKMSLRLEPLDVQDVVEDVTRLMRNRAEASGLSVAFETEAGLPEAEADYRALKQVLLNLLSNALKFTPRGGRVTISARSAGIDEDGRARIAVAVTDTGIGIAAKDLARLARPFEQIESQHAKTSQGTGLGLALTKSLVELLGGTLSLASEPGRGTTVGFTLKAAVGLPVRRSLPAAAA